MVNESGGRKAALVCGSVAYDTILVFPDRFKSHLLPDKLHMLNVSFLVPEMRREFGGCAANIAYGLKLLGDEGIAMATAGHDFAPYRERMVSKGIPVDYIKVIDEAFTAQALHHHRSRRQSDPRHFIPVQCNMRTSTRVADVYPPVQTLPTKVRSARESRRSTWPSASWHPTAARL